MQFSTNPLISIIIPCYNHGVYIREALQSIENCKDKTICEVIIIDDGSTDPFTIEEMDKLSKEGWRVIRQHNQGLGAARNTGVANAVGKYILPLDADNRIRNTYLSAASIMENDPGISVVYGDAQYFGSKDTIWKNQPWSLQRLMLSNFIDACTLIRSSSLKEVGNYSTDFKYSGYEDWDLWLKMAFKGYGFYYLNEICFDYRVLDSSMVRTLTRKKGNINDILDQMYQKHAPYMDPVAVEDFILQQYKKNPLGYYFKLFLKAYLPSFYSYLYKKNLVRKYF
jgi:glycosyltransferase involved in cell wall biosynthesis